MTTSTADDTATPTRRERLRAATMAEIRSEAHQLLAAEGLPGVSLRAVARRMGLTPAALYRYVDSHEQLLEAMSVDIHEDLVLALEAARDDVPADAPGQRLIEVSRAFRRWALEHPHDFGLVFANPMTAPGGAAESELEAAGWNMGAVFAGVYADLLRSGAVRAPSEAEIDPDLLAAVAAKRPVDGVPLTALVRFVECWTRIYGCVSLEVSGHLHWAMDDTTSMFEVTLRQCADLLGAPELYAR